MARARKPFNQQRRLEASGIPRRGDRSPELQLMMARRLGLAEPVKYDSLPVPEPYTSEDLGNHDLPIGEHKMTILETIRDNPITICLAETGSGKSTQIPQYLLERGYDVTLTQPRRLAAEMVSRRINQEVTDKLGPDSYGLVGFQTAERGTVTEDTRLQVVTDGLQLVRELGVFSADKSAKEAEEPRVIVIDEVHERNTNIDVLLAWAKLGLLEGSKTRIVITTAGINAERMARYFSVAGYTPPIIEIPGRTHGIEKSEEPQSDVVEQAIIHARRGDNVLVFLPGLAEIDQAMAAVQKRLSGDKGSYELLPLHGQMTPQQQRQVEIEYPHPKIVFATNVAETSITIPDVDTVVDSGLERRKEIDEEGVESLVVGVTSQASCKQRAGRCGRTKPGTYVLTRLNNKVEYTPLINREEYSKPEILRTNVDKTVLSVSAAGLDITRLPLFDPLDGRVVKQAKDALRVLGALDDEYSITERGRRMNKFPVRPSYARMITYAEEQNYKLEVKRLVAAMIAAAENGGLPDYSSAQSRTAWRKLTGDSSSDLLAQLDMYLAVLDIDDNRDLAEHGLNPRKVHEARMTYHKLLQRMGIPFDAPATALTEDERSLLRECIVAGMIDFVYERKGADFQRTSARLGKTAITAREISDRSVIKGKPNLVVGTPYALSSPPGRDLPERHIIQDVTVTSAQQLGKVAATLCEWQPADSGFVWKDGVPYVRHERLFRQTVPTGEFRNDHAEWSPQLAYEIIAMLRRKPGRNMRELVAMKKESQRLRHLSGTVSLIHDNQLSDIIETVSGLTKKTRQRKPMNPEMLDLALAPYIPTVRSWLPSEAEVATIAENSPDFIEVSGLGFGVMYRNGKPLVAKITDELKRSFLQLDGELKLPDGRDILIPHKIGRADKKMTLSEFKASVRSI